jgi:hypothetical protein
MVMGTPHYMSPEQVRGEKADTRSDVFALGSMFYELLAGRKAFDGDSMHTVLFQVLQEEPEPIRSWVDLPPILVEVIEKALQKDPAARFHDASQMLAAVRAVRRAMANGRMDATLESELGPFPPAGAGDPRVVGSIALQPHPGSVSPPPATLSAKAPTQMDPRRARPRSSVAPPRPSPSRAPLYVGGGLALVGLLLAGGLVALLVVRRPAPAVATEMPRPINDLTRVLVASQVELARSKLDEKSYRAAAIRAEQALRLDPKNDEAKQVLAKAQEALQHLDSAAGQTRAALAAGDIDKATRGLWDVLSLDPRYDGIDAFVAPLNPVFRDQAARAKQLMAEARTAADRAKASALPGFAAAASAGTEGDALLATRQFAAAAARFLDERDDYERARRSVQR